MRHLESTFIVVVPLSFVVHTDTFQLWSINGHNQIDLVVGWVEWHEKSVSCQTQLQLRLSWGFEKI